MTDLKQEKDNLLRISQILERSSKIARGVAVKLAEKKKKLGMREKGYDTTDDEILMNIAQNIEGMSRDLKVIPSPSYFEIN